MKVWGGEVREVGLMMLVLFPVPYVDASAASAFPSKWRRAVVAGAGIMAELAIAAAAILVWAAAEPGLVRAAAFNAALIGGVSTLLFNGNPLLRFDGYYVFADLVEIPNLAQRANRQVFHLIKRHAFGLSESASAVTARGEAPWLVIYSVAAFIYRFFIVLGIALFIAGNCQNDGSVGRRVAHKIHRRRGKGRNTRFHIRRPTAPQLAILNGPSKWIARPVCRIPRRHHIGVAVEAKGPRMALVTPTGKEVRNTAPVRAVAGEAPGTQHFFKNGNRPRVRGGHTGAPDQTGGQVYGINGCLCHPPSIPRRRRAINPCRRTASSRPRSPRSHPGPAPSAPSLRPRSHVLAPTVPRPCHRR